MAITNLTNRSLINVSKISKSVFSLKTSVAKAQNSADSISKSLIKRNQIKRQAISNKQILFEKRRESVRRREQEDIIESSTIPGAIRRTTTSVASSTKGFLGRILDFVGTLLVGWAVVNLPTIIKLGQELTVRIQKVTTILSTFFADTGQFLRSFGDLLRGVFNNVTRFDFTDQSGEISKSMTQIERSIQGMENGFDEAINLLKQPFDFSMPEREQQQDQKEDQTSDPGTSDGSQSSGGTPAPQVMLEGGISGTTALLPRGAKGADPDIGATDRFGYSSWRGRHHNGIDIGTTGQKGYYVAFLLDGTATLGNQPEGAGLFVEIKSGGTTYKFFHLARFSIASGPYKAGTAIGEIGTTGSSTGIHLHYEVHPPGSKGVDPTPYLNLIKIGKKLGKPTPAPASGQSSGQPSQPVPKGGTLSTAQLVALAKQSGMTKNVNVAGYKGPLDVLMGAVGMQESRGKSDAFRNDTKVYGLWQIRYEDHVDKLKKLGITSPEQLYDPLNNAKAAKAVYDSQGITAWSGFTDGKYKLFLPEAQKAAGIAPSQYQAQISTPAQTGIMNGTDTSQRLMKEQRENVIVVPKPQNPEVRNIPVMIGGQTNSYFMNDQTSLNRFMTQRLLLELAYT